MIEATHRSVAGFASGFVSSSVPDRLRGFVSADADLLADVLTQASLISLVGTRVPGLAADLHNTKVLTDIFRLYRSGVAADEWVLRVAEQFDRADRRGRT